MEKITSIYTFSVEYSKHAADAVGQKATVRLEINYRSKEFAITPNNGQKHFGFIDASHNSNMWKATVKAIENAIDFANKELHG